MTTKEYSVIAEEAKDYCIKNTVSLSRTFTPDGEKIQGKLVSSKNTVLASLENGITAYVLCIDDDDIHGNTKNAIAKEFCEKYTLSQLQDEYIEELQQKANISRLEEEQKEADKIFFNEHSAEISNCFKHGLFKVYQGTYTAFVYEYNSEHDMDYNYKGLSFEIEIRKLAEDNFKINAIYYSYLPDEKSNIFTTSYADMLLYLQRVAEKINLAIDNMNAERIVIYKQKQYESNFRFKCFIFATDKRHTYIFKTARGSFCVNNGIRWSNKGEGKFYKVTTEQLYKLLTEKNITTYAKVDADNDNIRAIVDTLEFIPIVSIEEDKQ